MEKEKLQEVQTRFGYPGGEDVGVLDIFPQKKGYPKRPEDLPDSTRGQTNCRRTKCRGQNGTDKMLRGQNVAGQNVARTKCRQDKMSPGHNVARTKCRQDKMSPGQNVARTKCRQDKMSPGQNVARMKCRPDEMSPGQNIARTLVHVYIICYH